MEFKLDATGLEELIANAINNTLKKQSDNSEWLYFSLEETATYLQVKTSTLLDKRQPYLNELEYSQSSTKIYWFTKKSVAEYVDNRRIAKYKR